MNIKNYTSTMPAEKSIAAIEKLLVDAGANNISKMYDEKELVGIFFNLQVNGVPTVFKLPCKVDKVYQRMLKSHYETTGKKPTLPNVRARIRTQALRTAWKILHEWIQLQVTMIQLDQMEVMEVFFLNSYDQVTGKTLYETIRDKDFMLLSSSTTGSGGKDR